MIKDFFRKFSEKKNVIPADALLTDSFLLGEHHHATTDTRVERRVSNLALGFFLALVILLTCVYTIRVSYLQIEKGNAYAARSEANRLHQTPVFAPRGRILDRQGAVLADVTASDGASYFPRSYFEGEGLAHVLGYVNYPRKDNNGYWISTEVVGEEGIERSRNDFLKGETGMRLVELDALRKPVSDHTLKAPVSGKDLHLTIDAELQEFLYKEIKALAENVDFSGGAGVILDVETGDLLALTSYPEFSSQIMTDREDQDAIQQIFSSEGTPLLNRATQGLYAPGSIIKPFVAIAALNEDIIHPEDKILSTGEIRVENPYVPGQYSTFVDWRAHGLVNVVDAIAVSSNVYFYVVGGGYKQYPGLGIQQIRKYVDAFDIATPAGMEDFPEAEGVIPHPRWKERVFDGEPWRLGDTYHTAIGQYGFQVTPIQMARAVAAIATRGKLPVPRITSEDPPRYDRVAAQIAQENYEWVEKGLIAAVDRGTARGLSTASVNVAAKTGTAEIGITKKRVNSWVMGYFPAENPRWAFTVVMEKGPHTNLVGATSIMRKTIDWMAIYRPEYLEGAQDEALEKEDKKTEI